MRYEATTVRCGGREDESIGDHDRLSGPGGGPCLVCSLRTRIAELEDTVRYWKAGAMMESPLYEERPTAREALSAIAARRGADWSGVEVEMEPKT